MIEVKPIRKRVRGPKNRKRTAWVLNYHDQEGKEQRKTFKHRRSALTKAVKSERLSNPWWISYEELNDAEGHNLSHWKDIDVVMRVYAENDVVCDCIVTKLLVLADAADKVLAAASRRNESNAVQVGP